MTAAFVYSPGIMSLVDPLQKNQLPNIMPNRPKASEYKGGNEKREDLN